MFQPPGWVGSKGYVNTTRRNHRSPFDFAQGRLSTTLRSGRDGKSICARKRFSERYLTPVIEVVIPTGAQRSGEPALSEVEWGHVVPFPEKEGF
jgi:hypothetical protein